MTHRAPSVFAIWSRPPRAGDPSGGIQQRVARRHALDACATLREASQPTVFQRWGKARGGLAFLASVMIGLLRAAPRPLQVALYAQPRRAFKDFAPQPQETLVFDSLRQILLLAQLRKRAPAQRIILDMDDLMSRRMELLLALESAPSLGAFAKETPGWFGRILAHKGLTRLILRYEAAALRRFEARACALADEIILISAYEASLLRARHPKARARITAIAPIIPQPSRHIPFSPNDQHGPLRCVFIGADSLVQNRTSIDHLLRYWADHRPKVELVLFGRQSRRYDALPAGVHLHGFVENLLEVYDGRSVLFCPTLLAGGVKTKVLEAISYGAPVIGTPLTWEGMTPHPAFRNEEAADVQALLSGDAFTRAAFAKRAAQAQKDIAQAYGPEAFLAAWARSLDQGQSARPKPQSLLDHRTDQHALGRGHGGVDHRKAEPPAGIRPAVK